MKNRVEVAILPDGHLFAGHPLDIKYIEALSFIVKCIGCLTFEIHGGDTPDAMVCIHSVSLAEDSTLTLDVSHLPRFVKPIVKRDDPTTPAAFFTDMNLVPQPKDYGLDKLWS